MDTWRRKKKTKYFCNLEINNYISEIIYSLILENGPVLRTQEAILVESVFIKKMYKIGIQRIYV